jgi:nitrite reductase (NO-forming)
MTAPQPVARRSRERLLGVALGVVLALGALSVAVFAGRSGPAATVAVGGGTRTVQVTLDNMRITPSVITVPSGTSLVLEVTNTDAIRHDLHLAGGPSTPLLSSGQHARLDVGPVTASMQGWCTVPGHRAAGMTMTIQVSGSASSMPGMGGTTAASTDAHLDPGATPAPGWRPYDAALPPAPAALVHKATFTITDTSTEVAPGVKQTLWTYNGTAPGPILRGHVGDEFAITIVNHGTMAHSIDFHAGSVSPDQAMRSIDPGQSLVYRFVATHSGAWLYHCSTMPMSLHIANGMYGAVIIDPPDLDAVAKEFVFVQSELYLGPQNGVADERKIDARQPDAVVFNGYADQYTFAPLAVRAGERIRVWVIDAGPQFGTAFHVVGTQFDTVFSDGAYLLRPDNPEHGAAQALALQPGQGGFVEFVLPAPGHYSFVDHAMVFAEHGATGVFRAS